MTDDKKNQFDKRRKDNKTLSQKKKKGGKKTLTENNKKEGTEDQSSGLCFQVVRLIAISRD
jgi:FKBP-type peptidyl-prolyl cis-trans isomerase